MIGKEYAKCRKRDYYYCTVRFQSTTCPKKYTYVWVTLLNLPMAPPLSPQFNVASNPFVFRFGFTLLLWLSKKKKRKKSHTMRKLWRMSSVNREALCPLSFPSLATLVRPAEAGKMTYCQGCDGSGDSGELLTPQPNCYHTKQLPRIYKVQKD